MLEKLRVVFTIPELRKKIFLTLLMLAAYRVGWQIPLPVLDQRVMEGALGQQGGLGDMLKSVAVFTASNLQNFTIFGLGIMPYISASIIMQLLGTFWAPLESLQKEGQAGRNKINQYTRYLTVVLCFIQSWFFLYTIANPPAGNDPSSVYPAFQDGSRGLSFGWHFISVLIMTGGTVLLMWIGEQIDEFGIGNGISLLIMTNILSNLPGALINASGSFTLQLGGDSNAKGVEVIIMLIGIFLVVVVGVVLMTLGQRRIPTHSAKHVRGNKVYGGSKEYLPLKVNQSGVMPIIFASSLLMFPGFIFGYLRTSGSVFAFLAEVFSKNSSFTYNMLFVALIFFFCYFWTAISFNPKEIADNLRNMGAFIPGHRPGTPTANYLEKVMMRITYLGAAFLAIIAILPQIVSHNLGLDQGLSVFFGGTSLLIAVSVAFDLVQKIDSHLVMRNYKGLLQ